VLGHHHDLELEAPPALIWAWVPPLSGFLLPNSSNNLGGVRLKEQ